MVFTKGRKPRARRRDAVAAASLRYGFSVRRSCHGFRAFLQADGLKPRPTNRQVLLPGNSGRTVRTALRAALAARKLSTTNAKSVDQALVARVVGTPQIIENLTPLRHQLQQPAPRMIVFDMRFEVLRQIVDTLRQECNLHFGRTGIVGFDGIRFDKLRFPRGCYRHRHQPLSLPARPAMPAKLNTRRGTMSPRSTSAMATS
jgi:hypothetical protein